MAPHLKCLCIGYTSDERKADRNDLREEGLVLAHGSGNTNHLCQEGMTAGVSRVVGPSYITASYSLKNQEAEIGPEPDDPFKSALS